MEMYKNYSYTIKQNNYTENPRAWDNFGTCIFRGKYSHLGDNHELDFSNCCSWKNEEKVIKKHYGKNCIIIPVYAYIHSEMTISTSPFSCSWDSGRLGSIVVSRATIRKEYGVSRVTKDILKRAIQHLESEITLLNQYITGDIWDFDITDDEGKLVESCNDYGGYKFTINAIHDIIENDIKYCKKHYGVQTVLILA